MAIENNLIIRILGEIDPRIAASVKQVNEDVGMFAGKVIDFYKSVSMFVGEGLMKGGDLAEATASLDALGRKYGQTSDQIVNALDAATDGQLQLLDLTRKASDALSKGFSPEQAAQIYQFATKVSDATGKSMEGVAAAVENALTKGRYTFVREFGIMATTGDEVFAQMAEKIAAMGEGVFNFGDSFKEVTNSVTNLGEAIWRDMNDLVGAAGFGGWAKDIAAIFNELRGESEILALGLFESLKAIFGPLINVAQIVAGGVADSFYIDFGNIKESAFVMAQGVSQTLFDLKGTVLGMGAILTMPVTKPAEWISGMLGDKQYAMSFEFMEKFSKELKTWNNIQGMVAGEAEASAAKMLAAYDPVAKQTKAIVDLENLKVGAMTTGNMVLGDQAKASKEAAKEAKELQKELDSLTKKYEDSYEDMAEAGEKFLKKQEDIATKTTRSFEDLATGYESTLAKLKRDLDRELEKEDLKDDDRKELWKKYYIDVQELGIKYSQDQAKIRTDEKRALEDAWKVRREEEAKAKASMLEYVELLKGSKASIIDALGPGTAQAKFFTDSVNKMGAGVTLADQDQARLQKMLDALKASGAVATGPDSRGGTGGVAGAGVPGKFIEQAGSSGSASIVLQAPRGDKIGEAIAEWLNKAAIASGALRAGV